MIAFFSLVQLKLSLEEHAPIVTDGLSALTPEETQEGDSN